MSDAYRNRTRKSVAGLLLAGCLVAAPAFSQEIIKWVDADGVTHFGHAATAARQAVREHMQDKAEEPKETMVAGNAGSAQPEAVVAATALAANNSRRVSPGGSD